MGKLLTPILNIDYKGIFGFIGEKLLAFLRFLFSAFKFLAFLSFNIFIMVVKISFSLFGLLLSLLFVINAENRK